MLAGYFVRIEQVGRTVQRRALKHVQIDLAVSRIGHAGKEFL